MPTSGTGQMTPVGGGPGVGASLAQPIPYTLLSLDRYARVMGINPAHFWGASAPNENPAVMPLGASCEAIWFKYEWQEADRVARYTIAQEIVNAERDIAAAIGYWPAPMWIAEEQHQYPRPHRREYFGLGFDVRNMFKGVTANFGRVVETGRRAVSLVGSPSTAGGSLVYSDLDSDGAFETATITFPTILTDANEIKVYHYGQGGDPDWEIREPRSKVVSGGFVTIVFDAWLLIDPDLYEELPTTDGIDLIDIGVTTNFVAAVDLYREYADGTLPATTFYWEPDYVGCLEDDAACDPLTQDGCLRIRNDEQGILVPVPASLSGSTWENATSWTGTREPDYLKVYYYAGELSDKYKRGLSTNPLSDYWAQTIAWLATARLPRPLCSCGNLEALAGWLMTDTAMSIQNQSFFLPDAITVNPFGSRNGEIAVWRRISKLVKKRTSVAVV